MCASSPERRHQSPTAGNSCLDFRPELQFKASGAFLNAASLKSTRRLPKTVLLAGRVVEIDDSQIDLRSSLRTMGPIGVEVESSLPYLRMVKARRGMASCPFKRQCRGTPNAGTAVPRLAYRREVRAN